MPEGRTGQDPRKALGEYAEREGYVMAEVFTERDESGSSAFASLMDALYLSEQPIVIVPSMCHFAHLPRLQSALKERIEQETGAVVIVIQDLNVDDARVSSGPATAIENDDCSASHQAPATSRHCCWAGAAAPLGRARAAPATPGTAGRAAPATQATAGRLDRRRDLDFLRACPGVTGDFWDNEATTSGAAPVAPGEYLLSAN
jgi:hypothetical protein